MTDEKKSATASLDALPENVRQRLDALRAELQKAAGDELVALIVFGSAARGGWRPGRSDVDVMVVVREDSREVLERIGHPLLLARYAARVEAIVLRADEVSHAADVFPLLYDELKEDGVALYGESPFASLHITDKHRRLRIEQELREARIRLRRMVTDSDGSKPALAIAVERKLRQVRSPLRALLKVMGTDPGVSLDAVLTAACAAFKIDQAALTRAQEDPGAAYVSLTKLLGAAIDEADRLND